MIYILKYTFDNVQKKAVNSICIICNSNITDSDIAKRQFVYVKSRSGKDQFLHMDCYKNESSLSKRDVALN